jgi:L-lactate dehydrogenase complex protein LldG
VSAFLDQFARKAEAIGATVHPVRDDQAAAELVTTSAPGATFTQSLAERFPGLAVQLGAGPVTREPIAPEVVGTAYLAIAETGSVLVGEAIDADRGACFLADRLWIVVSADSLVPTLDIALERIRTLIREGRHYVTLMSGPSRTADIERMLTIGVHGPRALSIVVVG